METVLFDEQRWFRQEACAARCWCIVLKARLRHDGQARRRTGRAPPANPSKRSLAPPRRDVCWDQVDRRSS